MVLQWKSNHNWENKTMRIPSRTTFQDNISSVIRKLDMDMNMEMGGRGG